MWRKVEPGGLGPGPARDPGTRLAGPGPDSERPEGMAAGGAGPAAWEVQSPWDWRQAWKASRVVYFGV